MARRRTSVSGRASVRVETDDRAYDLTTDLGVEADERRVAVSLDPTGRPLVSEHPAVVRHWGYLGIEAERQVAREEYANRPVVPLSPKGPRLETLVPCPSCDSDGAPWPDCHLCRGTGGVLEGQARAWRQERHQDA